MNYNNFKYGMTLTNMLYGIELSEDDWVELALIGWGLIGNKRTRIYRYLTCVSDCDEGVLLPCNVDEVEAVTTAFEDWAYSTNDTPEGDLNSAYAEAYIESRKAFRSPLYAKGKFIKYEQVGDMLYFDRPHGKVNILYRGLILDDDDLPEITDKEATALATYVAYITKYKEGLMTNNGNILNIAEDLRKKWLIQCDLARIDKYMSQNEWDLVLEAKATWDRKQYGKSFKVFR